MWEVPARAKRFNARSLPLFIYYCGIKSCKAVVIRDPPVKMLLCTAIVSFQVLLCCVAEAPFSGQENLGGKLNRLRI